MRRILIASFVLAVAAPTASHAGAASPRTAPKAPSAWSQAVRPDARHKAPVSSLAHAFANGHVKSDKLQKLRATTLTDSREHGGSGLKQIRAATQEAAASYPIAVLDLTGDGTDETLIAEPDRSGGDITDFVLGTRHPDDLVVVDPSGDELWRLKVDPYAYLALQDFTGDGTPEILIISETASLPSEGAIVAAAQVADLTNDFSVYDGATGAVVWHATTTARLAYAVVVPLVAIGEVAAAEDLLNAVIPMGDANADGIADLFVGTADFEYAFACCVAELEAGKAQYHATVLSGKDGSRIARTDIDGAAAVACALICVEAADFPWAFPADDLSGDGRPDLLVRTNTGASEIAALPIDGSETYWTTSADPYSYVWTAKLRASDPSDVVISSGYFAGDGTRAVNGADGSEFWSFIDPPSFFTWEVRIAGDINGDGGLDLSILGDHYTNRNSFPVIAGLSGSDLSHLWVRKLQAAPRYTSLCYCWTDLNGDGLIDDLVATALFDADGGYIGSRVRAISGATGLNLWSFDTGPDEELPLPAPSSLGGFVVTTIRAPGAAPAVRVFDGSTGAPLWSVIIGADEGADFYAYYLGAQLNGDPSPELVLGVFEDNCTEDSCTFSEFTSAVSAAGELWRI